MTIAKRMSIVRTLSLIQIVIPMFFLILGGLLGLFFLFSDSMALPPTPLLFVLALLYVIALAVTVGLPWMVIRAINVRTENWAMAAYVSLIVQIVAGGGVLSLFPIISLVLLLDKEASAYIGMK